MYFIYIQEHTKLTNILTYIIVIMSVYITVKYVFV